MLIYTTLNILVYVETFNTCGHYGNDQQLHHKNNPSNPIDKLIHKDSNQAQGSVPDCTIIFNNKQERWEIPRLVNTCHHIMGYMSAGQDSVTCHVQH